MTLACKPITSGFAALFSSAHFSLLLTFENQPVALIECDTDPLFLPPDDVAGTLELIAQDEQREAVGDEQRGRDF